MNTQARGVVSLGETLRNEDSYLIVRCVAAKRNDRYPPARR